MLRQGDNSKFYVKNLTKGRVPSLPFVEIKNAVLGKKYELSLVFSDDALLKRLNRIYRGKNKTTNVLSFSLSKTSGEIFLNLSLIKKEFMIHDSSFKLHVLRLFIHALLHLKGMSHGSRMERAEIKFLKKFNFC
ncbi:MAG TPA: rRNA maturation RNase YbeY [Candidatus Paceibacterota bacterium]